MLRHKKRSPCILCSRSFSLSLSTSAFRKRCVAIFKGKGSWNRKLWDKNLKTSMFSQMRVVYAPWLNHIAHAHTISHDLSKNKLTLWSSGQPARQPFKQLWQDLVLLSANPSHFSRGILCSFLQANAEALIRVYHTQVWGRRSRLKKPKSTHGKAVSHSEGEKKPFTVLSSWLNMELSANRGNGLKNKYEI